MRLRRRQGITGTSYLYTDRVRSIFGADLLAHWRGNDPVGSLTVDDFSPNGHDAAVEGGATFGVEGKGDGLSACALSGVASGIKLYNPDLFYSVLPDNGGFEDAQGFTIGWNTTADGGSIDDEIVFVHAGGSAHACKLTGSGGGTYFTQTITVVPGREYTLSFWAAGDGTHAGLYAILDQTHSTVIKVTDTTGVTAAVYTEVTYTFTVPAGCFAIGLVFYCPVAAGSCYWDDITLVATSTYTGPRWSFNEGTALIWVKVPAAEWTVGGSTKYIFRVKSSVLGNEFAVVTFGKGLANNTLFYQWHDDTLGGGGAYSWNPACSLTYMFPLGMVWSQSGGYVRPYLLGGPVAPDIAWHSNIPLGLGSMVMIGAESDALAGQMFKGSWAHCIIANRAATDAEMALLAA